MNIKLSYDASVASAPGGFQTAMQFAATTLDALITNNITVNINVGYGEYTAPGQNTLALTGTVSEGGIGAAPLMSYANVVADLTSSATTPAAKQAVANLPAADPTNGGMFLVTYAQEKAWGIQLPNSTENDGTVGFGAGGGYDYSINGTTGAGLIDFVGVAEHELTHALGRLSGLQSVGAGIYSPLDLFRYASAGTLQLSSSAPAYFSIDGGRTNLNTFATSSDLGDWASSAGADALNAMSSNGQQNIITAADSTEMAALGFNVACFAAGTRVATTRGMVAVEALRVGDVAVTAQSGSAPVVWLGHRCVACRRHPRPHDVMPVRVQADAFADGQPGRDLWLSPDHAVFVGGALIPVRYLVNGASIAQQDRDRVDYWHVELPSHDVLLAEGLPVESFLDTGNRAAFAGGETTALHPDFARRIWRRKACAKLLLDGPRVTHIRRRLLARAVALGHVRTDNPGLTILSRGDELAVSSHGPRWRVLLPASTSQVTLRSRVWTPAHMRPYSGDTRVLGVAIGRLWLDGRETPLDAAALGNGWHTREGDWRWTRSDARLAVAGAGQLVFELVMTGHYWAARQDQAAALNPAQAEPLRFAG